MILRYVVMRKTDIYLVRCRYLNALWSDFDFWVVWYTMIIVGNLPAFVWQLCVLNLFLYFV
jgi:hypothetical protein